MPGTGRRRLPIAALLVATAIWGSTFVVLSGILQSMPVWSLLLWRFGIATTLLLILRPRALRRLDRTDLRHAGVLGLMLWGGYALQTWGLLTISATVSGFIVGMFLVFTPFVAWAMTREPLHASVWGAVLLATIGLVLLSFSGLSISTGAVLTLGAALLFAIQIVGLSLWTEPAKAYGMAVVQLAVVTVMSGIATPFESGAKVPPTPQVWVALLYLAVFATSVAFVIQSWGQAHVAPTQAAVILTMEPVFAGLFGFLAGEPLTLRIVLGGVCVLTAMYLVELGPRRAREAALARLEL